MFRGKFSHVSPVWYSIKPNTEEGGSSGKKARYQLHGGHDVDQGWIKEVKGSESSVKVVPRFILEGFSRENIVELIQDPSASEEMTSLITAECMWVLFLCLMFAND
jgi:chitinase domain-containing protein 1